MSYNELMDGDLEKRNDVKYNIFKFQDHLLEWMRIISVDFYKKNYSGAYEGLQNLYLDTIGFFDAKEQKELKELYMKATAANAEFSEYSGQLKVMQQKKKGLDYSGKTNLPITLLNFRYRLMEALAKHQVLIPIVKRNMAGAGRA